MYTLKITSHEPTIIIVYVMSCKLLIYANIALATSYFDTFYLQIT